MNTPLVRRVLLAALLLVPTAAVGQSFITESYPQTVGSPVGDVPDGTGSITLTQIITGSRIQVITGVEISLHLTGTHPDQGWAGDMFVSLNRNLGGQTAVLLNQAGVSGTDPVGFSHDGWDVVFRDDAANGDVHEGLPDSGSILTGVWQPDGRLAPTSNERLAMLGVFNGAAANGTWHLTLADLSPGGGMTVRGWTVSLTGTGVTPVPEPGEVAVVTAGLLAGFAVWRRRSR